MSAGRIDFSLGLDVRGFGAQADFAAKRWDDLKQRVARNPLPPVSFGAREAGGLAGFSQALRPLATQAAFAANPEAAMAITTATSAVSGLTRAATAAGIGLGAMGLVVGSVVAALAAAAAAIQAIKARQELWSAKLAAMDTAGRQRGALLAMIQEAADNGEISSAQRDQLYDAAGKPGGTVAAAKLLRGMRPSQDQQAQTDFILAAERAGQEDPFAQRRADIYAATEERLKAWKAMVKKSGAAFGDGRRAVLDLEGRLLDQVDADEAKAKEAGKLPGITAPKLASARPDVTGLERMGFVMGGGGNPLLDTSRRTAKATERTALAVERLASAGGDGGRNV